MKDIEEFIQQNYSKEFAEDLAGFLVQNPQRIPHLLQIVYRQEEPISRRAAWYFSTLFDKDPELVYPFTDELVSQLPAIKSQSILRAFLRTIGRSPISENHHGYLLQYASETILNPKSEIAVKAMAMDIFFQIAKSQPDLLQELEQIIDFIYPESSRGIQNKCRHFYKDIENLRMRKISKSSRKSL